MNNNVSLELTRRDFLRRSAAGAAGVTLGLTLATGAQAAASQKKIPIGLQLYSLREQCKTDLPGMLAAVSKIGYKGVEFAGYHGRTAKELQKMLADNGLIACGTHTPYIFDWKAFESKQHRFSSICHQNVYGNPGKKRISL